jgi:hypothetical protein
VNRIAPVRRLLTIAGVVAVSSLTAACGVHHSNLADANNDGTYVKAGPVTYQLEVSRLLNQYTPEDSGYLQGVPKGVATLAPNQEWYGVFMWAKNQTKQAQLTSDNFEIVDTQGHVYKPVPVHNPYAWSSQPLAPGAIEPSPQTTAGFGPTQGGLLLFKVPSGGADSVYANRPLTLEIIGNTGKVWGTVSLDL